MKWSYLYRVVQLVSLITWFVFMYRGESGDRIALMLALQMASGAMAMAYESREALR